MRRIIVILLTLLVVQVKSYASDDFQYWSWLTLKTPLSPHWQLDTHAQLRLFDDASDPGLSMISERLKYQGIDHLELALNYSYLDVRTSNSDGSKEFKYQHRIEPEISPYWTVNDDFKIKNRNRFEFRWLEDRGSDNARYRQKWYFIFPRLKLLFSDSFYASNEFFYDFNRSEITENRLVPAGFSYKLNNNMKLNIFYMLQSKKGSKDWSSNQIIGSHLTLQF